MPFATYNGAVVTSPIGKPTLAYVIRQDLGQIAALDLNYSGTVDWCEYHFHPFTGDSQDREQRKKVVQIDIFGEGNIPTVPGSAYLIVVADEQRSDVYPYSVQSAQTPEGILWQQKTLNLVGRQFDVVLLMVGSGIKIRECGWQYSIVG